MRTLYFECAMGAAGDMLMGALYELCPAKEKFLTDMNALLPGVTLEAEAVRRQGIAGTHMRVAIHGHEEGERHHHHHEHEHHHHEHHSLADIEAMCLPLLVAEIKKQGIAAQISAKSVSRFLKMR